MNAVADLSSKMLAEAAQAVEAEGLSGRITVQQADAQDLSAYAVRW
jgi:23S rRNA G2445 N2-methylase RlmL